MLKLILIIIGFPFYMIIWIIKLLFSMFSWVFMGFTILLGIIFDANSKK